MLRKTVTACLLILLTGVAVPARAAAPLTLDSAIQKARADNPDLARLEAAVDESSWKRLEALSAHLPHVSLRGEHLLSAKYARLGVVFNGAAIDFPAAIPQSDFAWDVSLLIFDGFEAINEYRAALLSYDSARHERDFARFKLEHEVRSRFYGALAAQLLEEVTEENVKTLEDHLAIARNVERSGSGTRFDVLRVEAQLEEARADRALTLDNGVVARRALVEVMGDTDAELPVLEGNLPVPDAGKVAGVAKADPRDRADLKALMEREEATDRQASAAATFWVPKVSFFAEDNFYKYGNFDPAILPNETFQNAYSFGIRFTWNLFDGGASLARGRAAVYRSREAEQTTRAALVRLPNDFDIWKRRFVTHSGLYRARLRTIDTSLEAVRLARAGLTAGTRTTADFLDVELDLFRARAGAVRAQLDAANALSNLELVLGHDL